MIDVLDLAELIAVEVWARSLAAAGWIVIRDEISLASACRCTRPAGVCVCNWGVTPGVNR
jgi:hypothetical protein